MRNGGVSALRVAPVFAAIIRGPGVFSNPRILILRYFPDRCSRSCRQRLCLADDHREHCVDVNLGSTPNPERVQPPMGLEPPEQPLYGCPTAVDGLPFRVSLCDCHSLLVTDIRVNDGLCVRVMLQDVPPDLLRGIGSISCDVLGPEMVSGVARSPQQRRDLPRVMDVTSGHVEDDGEFVGGIRQHMNLVAPDVLLVPFGVGLDAPSRIGIRRLAMLVLLSPSHPFVC